MIGLRVVERDVKAAGRHEGGRLHVDRLQQCFQVQAGAQHLADGLQAVQFLHAPLEALARQPQVAGDERDGDQRECQYQELAQPQPCVDQGHQRGKDQWRGLVQKQVGKRATVLQPSLPAAQADVGAGNCVVADQIDQAKHQQWRYGGKLEFRQGDGAAQCLESKAASQNTPRLHGGVDQYDGCSLGRRPIPSQRQPAGKTITDQAIDPGADVGYPAGHHRPDHQTGSDGDHGKQGNPTGAQRDAKGVGKDDQKAK